MKNIKFNISFEFSEDISEKVQIVDNKKAFKISTILKALGGFVERILLAIVLNFFSL